MPFRSLYTQFQRFLATMLLFSFLLEGCYDSNTGRGEEPIPQAQEASGGDTPQEEGPYDNSCEQLTTTTADNRPIEPRQGTPDSEQAQEQPGQQGCQAKRQEREAVIEEVSEEPAQPGPAIIPPLPLVTQPSSQVDKTPQHTASQVFLAQGGQQGRGNGGGEPSGVDQPQEEPSPGKQGDASGSVLSHDLRAIELTESRGPTDLEGAQQEAVRLKEKITELYSTLPQATEEADSKVVYELITHLKDLSKLERLWRLEQGSAGAKESIARLREAHRTSWGQTEYGASISKQLTALLVQACGQELKRVTSERLVDKKGKTIKSKTSDEVARLARVLGELAALHQEQGAQTGELSYYTDAATLYQNILRICEEEQDSQEQIESAYMGLAKIRRDMLARVKGRQAGVVAQGHTSLDELQKKLREEVRRDKQVLENLRRKANLKVKELEALLSKQGSQEKEYIKESRALFSDIAKQVREFLARLYQESAEELIPVLGPPPCNYTVVGLGSMALAQMTPYSDLKFAILMEEGTDKAAAREYLRQLTHLVHFRVINLGETMVPEDKYGVNLDHLGKRGIRFDLGGKTPLGRKDKRCDLIQPVAGMLRYLSNEGEKIEHIDKNLPYILESTCYVHGDKELYEVYKREQSAFLKQEQVCKSRALRVLQEGVVERDYIHPGGIAIANPKQPGDLAAFKSQFDPEDAERLYDVKQEIYCLPDRLLYGLAMYYGLVPESGWDAVEQLAGSGIIGVGAGAQEAAHHLKYAVSFATLLRLKTYLHHDQQGEDVTMLSRVSTEEAEQAVTKAFLLPPEALQAGGSLLKYYYTALALHSNLESLFEAWEEDVSPTKESSFFREEPFYDDSDATRGSIYQRLLQYKQAIACYERALAINEEVYGSEHLRVATILHNLGSAWYQLEDPKKAIACYKRALFIDEQVYGPEHPEVATDLQKLGSAWEQLGDPKEALECYKRALSIDEQVYGPEHPEVATDLQKLGSAWEQLGDPKESLACFKRALSISEQAYGSEHPNVALSLNNLGIAWCQLGDFKKAIGYFEQALSINGEVHGSEHFRATILDNLGRAWNDLGDPKKAIECYKRALSIDEQAYGPEHPMVATKLNNLGSAWYHLGNPKEAIEYYKQAKAIEEKVYGPGHPEVATSLNGLGLAWDKLGDPEEAIECFKRTLSINEQVYGPEHPEVATSLNGLGLAWDKLGDSKQAISYFERSLHIMKKTYGEDHPSTQAIKRKIEQLAGPLSKPLKGVPLLRWLGIREM